MLKGQQHRQKLSRTARMSTKESQLARCECKEGWLNGFIKHRPDSEFICSPTPAQQPFAEMTLWLAMISPTRSTVILSCLASA